MRLGVFVITAAVAAGLSGTAIAQEGSAQPVAQPVAQAVQNPVANTGYSTPGITGLRPHSWVQTSAVAETTIWT